jgi:hypothetical protein
LPCLHVFFLGPGNKVIEHTVVEGHVCISLIKTLIFQLVDYLGLYQTA